jgi:CheY-like chemotaxis protein
MPQNGVVADDVRASRELVGHWMEEFGYESDVAKNGNLAWESILQLRPDIVVTDIEMPGKSGLELLRQIREHSSDQLSSTPVVVITSLNDAALESRVLGLGATAVLFKPLVKKKFQQVIDKIHRRAS